MRETAETSGPRKAAGDKASRTLSIAALLFVALAAVMGWGASFVGLHEYGMQSMAGFSYWSAWLVPATFDGAAFACTLMTYRSSINGRSALRGRILMWAFTAVSSWINWIHQPTREAQIVAAGLPIAAVAVFDVVLLELRADYEARHGKRGFRLRPGLLVLRWMVDRTSTRDAFRKQVIDIPVEEIAGLGPVGHQDGEAVPEPTERAPEEPRRNGAVAAVPVPPVTLYEPKQKPAAPPAPPPPAEPAEPPTESAESAGPPVVAEPEVEPAENASERTQRIPIAAPVPKPELTDDEADAAEQAAESTEQTLSLPPIPDHPMSDEEKRLAARHDYRASLEADRPANGAQLGKRYGMSARWGRNQIAAAREEMRSEQHPRLVAVDGG